MSSAPGPRRLHHAWVVAAVTFLTLLAAQGFRSTIGVFVVPLQEDFGWGRDDVSLAIAVNLVCYGLMAPFAAALVDRLGPRRVMVVALGAVGAGSALTVWMTALWQLDVIWGPVIGMATGAISIPLSAMVATRWFVARRGLVTGLLTGAFATGNLIFLPLLAWITDTRGWQWAAGLVAVFAALIVPVVAVLMRDHPEDAGVLAYGADGPPPPRVAPPGNPFTTPLRVLRDAARVRDFWLLAGTFFVCGWTTNGAVQSHLMPAAHDHAIPEVRAAGLLALIGVFDIIGATASGWLTDRVDPRRLLFVYYSLRGISLAMLVPLFSAPGWTLVAFAVVYGLDWVATVPPTVVLTQAAFGRDGAGVVFGWVFCSHMLGGAAAAWLAGAAREALGDYVLAFTAAGMLGIAAGFASLFIARGPRTPLRPVVAQA
ncbi:MAG: MFS transporter [Thermoleophilia bacterium]|nr:MFS transporter [Thermoleophilia bacterium]